MEIETKLGTIRAIQYDGPRYPGIGLVLERNGVQLELCRLEVDMADEDVPTFKMHMWTVDVREDEPVRSEAYTAEDLDRLMQTKGGMV